jgi:hypothetical protein
MSHTDIIIITVTVFISSTAGLYAVLKYINQHTRPPVNTLTRRGDIELQYIEPSSNNNLDLLQPQPVHTSERVYNISEVIPERVPCTSEATYNTSDGISNYLSQPEQVYSIENTLYSNYCSEDSMNMQTVPSYIYSCLEDSINLNYIYFILFIYLFILFIYLFIYFNYGNVSNHKIKKYFYSNYK